MGNAAIDWNSLPTRWRQFDSDASDPDAIRDAEKERYASQWANDELVDEAYPPVLQQLIDEHPDLFLEAMSDYRTGDTDEFCASAGRLIRQLESIVKEQV